MPKISVIVPCFNEEAVLPKLFDRLERGRLNMETRITKSSVWTTARATALGNC